MGESWIYASQKKTGCAFLDFEHAESVKAILRSQLLRPFVCKGRRLSCKIRYRHAKEQHGRQQQQKELCTEGNVLQWEIPPTASPIRLLPPAVPLPAPPPIPPPIGGRVMPQQFGPHHQGYCGYKAIGDTTRVGKEHTWESMLIHGM